MLTLVTGTPGAGKTLLTTWDIAQPIPGSTIEQAGVSVPRRLLSNIRDLVLDHQHIDAKDLECWHTWAKPGDVIVFDEVQEVWRPRGLGTKIPPEIAALETHRHLGVDIVLITQHPMLIDPNIRRLVNQHIHLRRITKGAAMVYEWDHCENPGNTRNCLNTRVFFHRKKMYGLYKSAQLHTKPKARLPALAWVGLALVAGLAYLGPQAYGRITANFKPPEVVAKATPLVQAAPTAPVAPASAPVALEPIAPVKAASRPLGCFASAAKCRCFDADGVSMPDVSEAQCREDVQKLMPLIVASPAAQSFSVRPPPGKADAEPIVHPDAPNFAGGGYARPRAGISP